MPHRAPAPLPSAASRRLRASLRARVKVWRRFDAAPEGPLAIRYTCRACGWSTVERLPEGSSPAAVARLVAYQAAPTGTGVAGVCGAETRAERDRRYPPRG